MNATKRKPPSSWNLAAVIEGSFGASPSTPRIPQVLSLGRAVAGDGACPDCKMSARLMSEVFKLDLSAAQMKARDTLLVICDHAKDDGSESRPGIELIMWKTGKSRSTVQRDIRVWTAAGAIRAVAYPRGGVGKATVFAVDSDFGGMAGKRCPACRRRSVHADNCAHRSWKLHADLRDPTLGKQCHLGDTVSRRSGGSETGSPGRQTVLPDRENQVTREIELRHQPSGIQPSPSTIQVVPVSDAREVLQPAIGRLVVSVASPMDDRCGKCGANRSESARAHCGNARWHQAAEVGAA